MEHSNANFEGKSLCVRIRFVSRFKCDLFFFYLRFDFTRAKAAHSEILPKPYENEISHNLDNAFWESLSLNSNNTCKVQS